MNLKKKKRAGSSFFFLKFCFVVSVSDWGGRVNLNHLNTSTSSQSIGCCCVLSSWCWVVRILLYLLPQCFFFFFCTSVFHKLTGSFSSPQTNTRDDSVSFLLKIIFRGIVCRRAVSCWHISLSPLCRATSQPMVFSEQPIRIFSLFLFFFLFLSFSETSFIVVDLPLRYKKAGKACFSFFLWLSRPLRLYFSFSESLRFTAFSDFHLISERL